MAKSFSEIVCPGCRMVIALPAERAAPKHCPHCLAPLQPVQAKEPRARSNPLASVSTGALLLGLAAFGALLSLFLLVMVLGQPGAGGSPEGKQALAPELLGQLEERDKLAEAERKRQEGLKRPWKRPKPFNQTTRGHWKLGRRWRWRRKCRPRVWIN